MTTVFERDTVICPHCGAEAIDDDDLCRFCGKIMVPSKGQEKTGRQSLAAGFHALKAMIRPMTAEELEEHDVAPANFSDPADPIWDDWHMES